MKFSMKDFFSKCDQIHIKTADLVTLTEEILNGKLHFLRSDSVSKMYSKMKKYQIKIFSHLQPIMGVLNLNWKY